MYDVIVVGAGPAGSAAAKKSSALGLKTLLLEKKALPRDKVCSGMVMGPMAKGIIREEFGAIPSNVLTYPAYLLGIMVHAPGVEPEVVKYEMAFAWRRELDSWMTQKAEQAGAEVRDAARVTFVEQDEKVCTARLDGEALKTRFIIGADGAGSTIRGLVWPNLRFVHSIAYRECYRGELGLDRNYFHWIFPLPRLRPRFDVNHKGECFLLEGGLKELRGEMFQFLRPYGFSEGREPLWKDGCISRARLAKGYFTGSFIPAQRNVLLVGDAALLQLPVSGEGIGTALKSGILAASSIAQAMASKREVAEVYLENLQPLLDGLKKLSSVDKVIEGKSRKGPKALVEAFTEGLRATFRIT